MKKGKNDEDDSLHLRSVAEVFRQEPDSGRGDRDDKTDSRLLLKGGLPLPGNGFVSPKYRFFFRDPYTGAGVKKTPEEQRLPRKNKNLEAQ